MGRSILRNIANWEAGQTLMFLIKYISYFLEEDEELQKMHDDYESGKMLTGELKKLAINTIWRYMSKFQEGAKYVAELKQMKDREIEHVVVDGLKS